MSRPFDAALLEAVDLLRSQPQNRDLRREARAQFAAFRARHGSVPMRLVESPSPASPTVEYDVLLDSGDGGTVAITWRADDGLPWPIAYADHWASNLVVSVVAGDRSDVTVREALLFLKLSFGAAPDLMERIVEQQLIGMAIDADPPAVSPDELREAADRVWRANALAAPGSINDLLRQWGISAERFSELIERMVQRDKLRTALTAEQVEPYFTAHTADFDEVCYLRIDSRSRVPVADLAARLDAADPAAITGVVDAARRGNGIEVDIRRRPVCDLPSVIANATAGTTVGPFEENARWSIIRVLERVPAALDDATRRTVEELLFRRWLRRRRESATVTWYWQ